MEADKLEETLDRLEYLLMDLDDTIEDFKFANAIRWRMGMGGTAGLYYLYRGKIYRCIKSTLFPVRSPVGLPNFVEV